MSKTLKTRPLAVRLLDPKDHSAVLKEVHNHEKGFCDLPERNMKAITERHKEILDETYPYSPKETCSYDWTYTGARICPCDLCTGHSEQKTALKRTRHKIKENLSTEAKQAQALLRDGVVEDDLDDLESPWAKAKPV